MAMRATSARMTADRVIMTHVGCRPLTDTSLPQLVNCCQTQQPYYKYFKL